MMLTGETVTICREIGGGIDDDGRPVVGELVETPVDGCVIQKRSTDLTGANDWVLVSEDVSFLMPGSHDLSATKDPLWYEARGWRWEQDGNPFVHTSAFGTHLEWTETPVKKVRAL